MRLTTRCSSSGVDRESGWFLGRAFVEWGAPTAAPRQAPTIPIVAGHRYAPYLARIAANWPTSGRTHTVEGTLVFADVSGFTALSERLAARGKVGAELLTDLLDAVFEQLLDAALDRGGDLLAFGGDALCLLFTDDGHERRGAATARELQRRLRRRTPAHEAIGRFTLGMSIGAETGPIHLVRAGAAPYEHLALGATVSATLRCESDAERGEILVGHALTAHLDDHLLTTTEGTDATHRRSAGDHRRVTAGRGSRPVVGAGVDPRPRRRGHAGSAPPGNSRLRQAGRDRPARRDHGRGTGYRPRHRRGPTDQPPTRRDDHRHRRVSGRRSRPWSRPAYPRRLPTTPSACSRPVGRSLRSTRRSRSTSASTGGGVYAGPVGAPRRRTYTVIGDTVNLAARLMARARAGTVVATAHTLDASRRPFALRAARAVPGQGQDPADRRGGGRPARGASCRAQRGVRSDRRARATPRCMAPGT